MPRVTAITVRAQRVQGFPPLPTPAASLASAPSSQPAQSQIPPASEDSNLSRSPNASLPTTETRPRPSYCAYCFTPLSSEAQHSRHVFASPFCRGAEANALEQGTCAADDPRLEGMPEQARVRERVRKRARTDTYTKPPPTVAFVEERLSEALPRCTPESNRNPGSRDPVPNLSPVTLPSVPVPEGQTAPHNPPGRASGGQDSRRADAPFIERFPNPLAGSPISEDRSHEVDMDAYMESCGSLGDPENFEAAELLMTTGLTDKAKDRHLKSKLYQGRVPWLNVGQLLNDVDRLPHGPDWKIHEIPIDVGGRNRIQYLCARNVVDVVRELIGNPRFKDHMRFAPERQYTSEQRSVRIFNEMWSGKWWWRLQCALAKVDPCATIAGLIISSDKTTVSITLGGQQAYPVYLSIGNISKELRRKPSERAMVLVGYLPIDEFKDVEDVNRRQQAKNQLIHDAMRKLLEPLKEASKTGVEMWCADGHLRRVYPIVAAYPADFPEQSLMACTSQGSCPICTTARAGRGNGKKVAPRRGRQETLNTLREGIDHNDPKLLDSQHLKPWWPWWADSPCVNFSSCITPDLLHQLYQGVFGAHAVSWMYFLMQKYTGDKSEMDRRFASMPTPEGMRHFASGISNISQWTGRESKEMAKQILPIVAGELKPEVGELLRALLDFMYLAHSSSLTNEDLKEMKLVLAEFHDLKNVMVREGYYGLPSDFDLMPKLHMIGHYPDSIRELGTPDGYSTEVPENLHIHFAKKPWRGSNKVRPTEQMLKVIQRQDAMRLQRSHINSYYGLIDESDLEQEPDIVWGEMEEFVKNGRGQEHERDALVAEEDVEVVDSAISAPGANSVGESHPAPLVLSAKRPANARLVGNSLANEHGLSNLKKASETFLETRCNVPRGAVSVSLDDQFDVWHRLYLHHRPLPFSPREPLRRDVVRASPAIKHPAGHLIRRGIFDTVLFLEAPNFPRARPRETEKFGVNRYRAARVRAIFKLPSRLQAFYSEKLAFVELFTAFLPSASSFHRMYAVTPEKRSNDTRRTLVIPASEIVLACHLAPKFYCLKKDLGDDFRLTADLDLLDLGKRFYLNHFYNHHFYLLMNHWRREQARRKKEARRQRSSWPSSAEILEHLRRHGCQDITSKLDTSQSSEYPISSGGFGDVHRGALYDESLVAVKCLRLHMDSSDIAKKQLKHAARELYVWSKCNHPNVLGLFGVAQYKGQIAMVSPWVEHSSTRRFLGSHPNLDRYNMCVQIAAGVMYLHSVGVVHGDIKGDNVLVSDELVPKLTDFGNAALQEYTLKFSSTTSRASTSLNWAAPELLDEDVTLTTEADVYALGMTILEVITGSIPYAGVREPTVVTKIIRKVHPARSEEFIPSQVKYADLLWALLKSCWAFDPQDRPISDEVWSKMKSIVMEKDRKD